MHLMWWLLKNGPIKLELIMLAEMRTNILFTPREYILTLDK
jgi:hypothetical protein